MLCHNLFRALIPLEVLHAEKKSTEGVGKCTSDYSRRINQHFSDTLGGRDLHAVMKPDVITLCKSS
jgi:hypothetical protein